MKKTLKSYLRETSGNFAMMAALFMGALVLIGGASVEMSRMLNARATLQGLADASALTGAFVAKNMIGDDREAYVRENINRNQDDLNVLNASGNAIITFNDDLEELTVEIPISLPSFFGGILGSDAFDIRAVSVVSYKTEAVDPVTIAFALDVSGSMGWGTVGIGADATGTPKIDVLQQSTKLLFEELEAGSPNPDLLPESIRTGMSAYNTALVDVQDMNWGWTHLEGAVDALSADGGTNSTPALDSAYQQIKDDREFRIRYDPKFNASRHKEYVIFMTDGDNNEVIWDEATATTCKAMREDGIELFSIAFTSPEKGEVLLLDCASWNDGIEKVDDPDLRDFAELANLAADETCDPLGNAFGNGNGNVLNNTNVPQASATGIANGNAFGVSVGNGARHCEAKSMKEEEKSEYYFDANNAETFRAAFARIGEEIANLTIRVKS